MSGCDISSEIMQSLLLVEFMSIIQDFMTLLKFMLMSVALYVAVSHCTSGSQCCDRRPTVCIAARYLMYALVPVLQTVQRQLKDSEKTSKEDASPVTIADYGAAPLH